MKKRLVSIATLAIFLVGVFGGSAISIAAAPQTAVTPTNATFYATAQGLKNQAEVPVTVPGLLDLRLKSAGNNAAYSFNADRAVPDEKGMSGYVLLADQSSQSYKNKATKARSTGELSTDVRNVLWNGYPYYGGGWSGVSGDPANYSKTYNLKNNQNRLKELYDIKVTQQAVWYFTDSKEPEAALKKDVDSLLTKAKANPAPVNFKLNLYDASAVKGRSSYAHMLATVSNANAAKNKVTIQAETKWMKKDGTTEYFNNRPSVHYELYEGEITPGKQPLETYWLPSGAQKLNISLINDGQKYTIREVTGKGADKFTTVDDQVVDLSKQTGATVPVNFIHIEKDGVNPDPDTPIFAAISLPVSAEVTLDGKTPKNGAFTLELRDSQGNLVQTHSNKGKHVLFEPLRFEQEGSYVYKLTEFKGDDKDITYDTASYEMTVTVTKEHTVIGDKTVLKANYSLKKNDASYEGLVPIFTNTSKAPEKTTTLTVKKVWKNDKVSSRPNGVSVQLYRNGSAYGELVRLDASNNWTYTWDDLDSAYKWTVNEPSVPSGYTKSLKNNGTTWTITNSGKSGATITTPSTTKPSTTKPGVTTTLPEVDDRGTPQTGDTSHLNWWITGATISLSGLFLVGLLWFWNRRKQHDKK